MLQDVPTNTDSSSQSNPTAATATEVSALIGRVAAGDRAGFAQLYQAMAPKLLGVVLRILRDRAWADDVVQETFLKIWHKAGLFDSKQSTPVAWLVSIARNGAIDELRKHPAGRTVTDDEMDQVAGREPTSQQTMEDQQAVKHLNECIDQLEKDRQDMVRLAYLNGWSRDQLASQYGQPLNTVKTQLRRALQAIKGCLES